MAWHVTCPPLGNWKMTCSVPEVGTLLQKSLWGQNMDYNEKSGASKKKLEGVQMVVRGVL